MSLFVKVDVNLPDDPKIVAAGPDAEHLYLRSLMLAKRIMTDGVIGRSQAHRLAGDLSCIQFGETTPEQLCARLVEIGLWADTGDTYAITAWLDWNKPAAQIKADAEKEADRKAAWKARRDAERDELEQLRATVSRQRRDGVATPVATRRESESESESESQSESERGGVGGKERPPTRADAPKSRGTRIPDPFVVTDDMVAWANTNHPGFDWAAETVKFKDHWLAAPSSRGVKADWPACWRNWIRRAANGEFR